VFWPIARHRLHSTRPVAVRTPSKLLCVTSIPSTSPFCSATTSLTFWSCHVCPVMF